MPRFSKGWFRMTMPRLAAAAAAFAREASASARMSFSWVFMIFERASFRVSPVGIATPFAVQSALRRPTATAFMVVDRGVAAAAPEPRRPIEYTPAIMSL